MRPEHEPFPMHEAGRPAKPPKRPPLGTPDAPVKTKTERCAFCGYRDARHRVVDAIWERIAAGEDEQTVLADYVGTDEPLRWLAKLSIDVYGTPDE